jgi:hypothetical protein
VNRHQRGQLAVDVAVACDLPCIAMAIRAEAVQHLIPFTHGFQAYAFIG